MPTSAALDAYYGDYYGADEAGGSEQITFSGVERFAAHIAAQCPDGAHRIVDFGGGDGAVALAVARILSGRGVKPEVLVIDYAEPAEGEGIPIRNVKELGDATGTFDVIIASAILEHVPDVGDVTRKLWTLGQPGSVFYARTPYWLPMLRLKTSIDMTFPGHVHDMGPEYWNHFLSTLALRGELIASQPSIVETSFRQAPVRTALAHLLKAPSRLECRLRGTSWRRPVWGVVGGWEVFARIA
ncbi:MAG: SAM-dependent methyltransferase [Bradymonadia bacterium]|jgi:SAM-dependent methyltransferase